MLFRGSIQTKNATIVCVVLCVRAEVGTVWLGQTYSVVLSWGACVHGVSDRWVRLSFGIM